MKPLTDKQKKAAWIIGAVLLMVHFAPNLIAIVRAPFAHRAAAPARPVQAPQPAEVVPAPLPDPNAIAFAQATSKFAGVWAGRALDPDQNMCQIRLEVRPAADKPGFFSGYEMRSCVPALRLVGGPIHPGNIQKTIKDASPISAMMTGSVIDGDLVFRVDKTVGEQVGPCQLTGYSASPFGTGGLMAEWKQGSCADGHMLLVKARG